MPPAQALQQALQGTPRPLPPKSSLVNTAVASVGGFDAFRHQKCLRRVHPGTEAGPWSLAHDAYAVRRTAAHAAIVAAQQLQHRWEHPVEVGLYCGAEGVGHLAAWETRQNAQILQYIAALKHANSGCHYCRTYKLSFLMFKNMQMMGVRHFNAKFTLLFHINIIYCFQNLKSHIIHSIKTC